MVDRGKRKAQVVLNNDKNLTHMAYRKIKEMMLNYELIPGQRLIFIDLAKRLGVSRTPVNSALSILANEGFLDFVPNQGYTVHQISREEGEALYEVREIIELGSIEKVIQKLTSEKLNLLKKQKSLYEKTILRNLSRETFVLDQEFHACYIRMAENPYLTDYFREVYQKIFLRHRIEGLPTGRAMKVVSEHDSILDAIRLRDVRKAKLLIKRHIRAGKEYIFSSIFS